MRHLKLRAVFLLLALTELTGCTRFLPEPQPEVRVTPTIAVAAAPIVAARCPRDGAGLAHGQGRTIVAGARPNGFVPVRVIRCAVTGERQRADAEVSTIDADVGTTSASLMAALELYDLRAPTPPSTKEPGFACAASYMFPFFLLLVDTTRHAYRPRLPVGACGNPQQPVLDALAAITWTSVGSFQVAWR